MTNHCHFHHIVATNNIFDIDVVTRDCRNSSFILINIILAEDYEILRNNSRQYQHIIYKNKLVLREITILTQTIN